MFDVLSPIAYLKIQRMNGVRRTLRDADPKITTVMQVAHQWGFCSTGHFCRDYKEMFGELPSETLKISRNEYRDIAMLRLYIHFRRCLLRVSLNKRL
ncbi:helix-turn-helix domain-containing protein [Nostoc sp. C117]|uniref:helix-turn-helix domain-containing protein n=1 Tax=Nostoc sp. C117 TaxID=3349875 RepID=UPI00370DCED8